MSDVPTVLQLRVFVEVVEAGSLTRACDQLSYLNPSSVSYHLHQLQTLYGLHLLERTARGVVPTTAGERLYLAARTVLTELDEASTDLQAMRGLFHGPFHIGTPQATFFLLTRPHQVFREQFPSVATGLFIYPTSSHALAGVLRLECHLTLSLVRPEDESFETQHFAREPLYLVVARDHPLAQAELVSPEQLSKETLLVHASGTEARGVVDPMLEHLGLHFERTAEALMSSQIKELLLQRKGVAILPASLLYLEMDYGLVQRVRYPAELYRDVWVCFLRRSPSRRMIENLLAVARSVTQSSAAI